MYLLCTSVENRVRYAPLYIRSFKSGTPRKLLEAQLFLQQHHSYEELATVPDRLRWCRHHMGLMQKEVAERIGISRRQYIELETGHADYYPKEVVDKLAALYQIPAEDLLDDFNRFLYNGQGRLIREHRKSLGLGKKPYARHMGISPGGLRVWESEEKRMTKATWEKYFKGAIII